VYCKGINQVVFAEKTVVSVCVYLFHLYFYVLACVLKP